MLWQKESTARDAFYIDLCRCLPNNYGPIDEIYESVQAGNETYKFCRVKNDVLAQEYRLNGNKKFAEKKYTEAFELFNQSLCFAENGSKLIGMAYSNRAFYFLKVKMYKNCLTDIELAKQNNYPTELFPKLEKVKNDCLKLMETNNNQSNALEPRLDFVANDNFPSLANVAEINYNNKYGRHIVANDDIEVGKTVMVEQSYLAETFCDKYKTCSICLRAMKNLQPCKNCTVAMFCPECVDNKLHSNECNFQFGPFTFRTSLMRSIVLAKNAFENVNQLIVFVKKMIANQKLPLLTEPQSKYQSFFKLWIKQNSQIKPQLIYLLYQEILNRPELCAFFKTNAHKRFLQHLIYHHVLVIAHDTRIIRRKLKDGKSVIKSHQLSITASYFNHSCVPNVCITHKNGFVVCVTIRPVQRYLNSQYRFHVV